MRKKTIWKNKTLSSPDTCQTFVGTATAPVEQAAIGDPGSERRIRPLDLATLSKPESDQQQAAPEFLRESVKELMKLQGLHIELLTESEEDGWTIPVTMLSNDDGEIDLKLCVQEKTGELRLRRASVFALKRGQEHVSAVFIETSPIHMKLYPTTGDDPEEVWQTLRCAAGDFVCKRESDSTNVTELINWVFDTNE